MVWRTHEDEEEEQRGEQAAAVGRAHEAKQGEGQGHGSHGKELGTGAWTNTI